jgi:hypothetical protein
VIQALQERLQRLRNQQADQPDAREILGYAASGLPS